MYTTEGMPETLLTDQTTMICSSWQGWSVSSQFSSSIGSVVSTLTLANQV